MKKILSSLCIMALFVASAQAQMRITEWMYNGVGTPANEFIEFTNIGSTPIDMTGWSFDDNSRTADSFSLSAFGTVAAGETVIMTESTAAAFRNEWSLAETVKIIGQNGQNLGRSDEINLYDASDALIDRLTFNDQGGLGLRTSGVSGNPISFSDLGANNANRWVLSVVGDSYGSYKSVTNDIANPGMYTVPEPSTIFALFSGMIIAGVYTCFRRIFGNI